MVTRGAPEIVSSMERNLGIRVSGPSYRCLMIVRMAGPAARSRRLPSRDGVLYPEVQSYKRRLIHEGQSTVRGTGCPQVDDHDRGGRIVHAVHRLVGLPGSVAVVSASR